MTAIVVLCSCGLLAMALGAAQLSNLSAVYRPIDIALTETPESFRAWLTEATTGAADPEKAVSERVASRLLTMPLEKRRAVAVALTRQEFWQPVSKAGYSVREIQLTLRDGILQTLRQAPMAGDLYFAAAWLEIRLDGFGERGRAFLNASHVFAPRELPFVVERLALAPLVWPLLGEEERAALKSDMETLRRAEPQRAEKIEALLAREGVAFP